MGVAQGPIVCVGAHIQGLFMRVNAVPAEGETVMGSGYDEPWDGGKATDYAVAAARLGAPVRLVTALGNDARGRRWREYFEACGIDTRWVLELAGATDVGVVMLPPSGIPAIVSLDDLSRELT